MSVRQMRIIYLHPHFTMPGGASRMVIETAKRLAARGHDVHVVCIRAEPTLVADAAQQVRFWKIGGPLSSEFAFWLNFRSTCRKTLRVVDRILSQPPALPTVLFPQVFPANWWGAFIVARRPELTTHWYCQEPSAFIHSVVWMNALPWPKNWIARLLNPWLKRFDKRACQRFKSVFVNSHFSKACTRKIYDFQEDRCRVVTLGVDLKRFHLNKSAERKLWVTTIGKISKFKNVDKIIEAIGMLVSQSGHSLLQGVQLQVIGTGDAVEECEALTRHLGLSEHVVFHQNLNDDQAVKILQQSKVFCLASVDEPFGLVAIEALACGTPVVAVTRGGPLEILANHDCGLLVPNGTARELSDAFAAILSSDQFELMSNAATLRASQFDWENTVTAIETVFDSN